jgi:hypothetical protein
MEFIAGDNVTLHAGFSSENGEMIAKVYPCGSQKMSSSISNLKETPSPKEDKLNVEENFKLFPNPTKNQVSILNRLPESASYRIINFEGKTVLTGTASSSSNTKVHLPELPSGTYLMLLDCKEISESIPFLIQN